MLDFLVEIEVVYIVYLGNILLFLGKCSLQLAFILCQPTKGKPYICRRLLSSPVWENSLESSACFFWHFFLKATLR